MELKSIIPSISTDYLQVLSAKKVTTVKDFLAVTRCKKARYEFSSATNISSDLLKEWRSSLDQFSLNIKSVAPKLTNR